MQTALQSILNSATRKNRPLNILTACTHESWESCIAKTGHNFYAIPNSMFKPGWNTKFRPKPDNYHILPSQELSNYIIYDVVFSQQRFGQHQVLGPLAKQMGLPHVTIEHTMVLDFWTDNNKRSLRQMAGDIDVFISEPSMLAWGWDYTNARVVHHGVETDLFKPRKIENKRPHILTVANDFIGRSSILGMDIWNKVVKDLPTHLVGETEGLSVAAKDTDELISFYQESTCYLNTTLQSPIPCAVLESLACGIPVVSTNNCLLPSVIEHGVNGFLSNSPKELREYCILLLNDKKLSEQMGAKARQTILDKFSLSRFINQWNEIFEEAANTPFRG